MDHQQANRQGGQCRLLEGCPHEERRVHSREQERQERIEGHEEGASALADRLNLSIGQIDGAELLSSPGKKARSRMRRKLPAACFSTGGVWTSASGQVQTTTPITVP